MSDTLFDQQNAAYAQLLYEEYAKNPESVPDEWRAFFKQGPEAARARGLLVPESVEQNGRSGHPHADFAPAVVPPAPAPAAATQAPPAGTPSPSADAEARELRELLPVVARAASFLQSYRDHGHMLARIDPLGSTPPGHPQLDPSFFGMSMEQLGRIPASVVMDGAPPDETVLQVLDRLKRVYGSHIGYEFEHIEEPERVMWLWEQVESGVHTRPLSDEDSRWLLERLSQVEGLEQFLHRAYLGQKRFSIEGTDMMVPMLDLALEEAVVRGGRRVVVGMAHRGRLNVLAHIMGVPYDDLLAEFEGGNLQGALHVAGTGDVKYHHGAEGEYTLRSGETVRVTMAPNPSHLEFVNPVVMGMARAWQLEGKGHAHQAEIDAVVPILIHGDAAFAAEGVVAESLNMARLKGYTVGGTIHIIANNQIGFTTDPGEGRSTLYASDLAKGFDFPVIHVNADEPDACLAAVRLAMAYRDKYHDDVVIDLLGYRRHGHNEGDEPAYTQPALYQKIKDHPTVRTLWARRLVEAGIVSEEEAGAIQEAALQVLRDAQDRVKEAVAAQGETGHGGDDGETGPSAAADAPRADDDDHETAGLPDGPSWSPPLPPGSEVDASDTSGAHTGVPMDVLKRVNEASIRTPEGFSIHPKLKRQLARRADDFGADTRLDWAYAESLAMGSLLLEGYAVRLSGQDAQRGTFSHRHLVLHDVETGEVHTPLDTIGAGRLEVYNSPLTEAGVMGFEYGYSVAARRDLILWEGQFGDFVNVAQVAIDQFISAGREKWGQLSNLTLLLPHGMEGQGPEHSSARLERFLQLCAEDNMRVAYPTTPAQYFHLLRRQARSRPERPLIVMTPKSLLRLPAASSTVADLVEGRFNPVLHDPSVDGREDRVKRLVLCSGKVYFDIQGLDRRDEADTTAVARVEELYPFPAEAVQGLVESYPNLEQVVWVQEEPRNMGALTYMGPRLRAAVPRHIPLRQVSRPERASPAEGKPSAHLKEQARIVHEALGLKQG